MCNFEVADTYDQPQKRRNRRFKKTFWMFDSLVG